MVPKYKGTKARANQSQGKEKVNVFCVVDPRQPSVHPVNLFIIVPMIISWLTGNKTTASHSVLNGDLGKGDAWLPPEI